MFFLVIGLASCIQTKFWIVDKENYDLLPRPNFMSLLFPQNGQ